MNGIIDILSVEGIAEHPLPHEVRLEVFPSLSSTNTYVRSRSNEDEGLVVCAAEQSEGRGRMGRSFFSPSATGLYMSVLLKPSFPPGVSTLITAAAAVAVARAIDDLTGKKTGIKWVNDIFLHGRKVCGILTEASVTADGRLDHAVLGIGVNVCEPEGGFPDELREIAGALVPEHVEGMRNRLCAAILNNFFGYYRRLEEREFLNEYRERSMVIGRYVDILTLSGEVKGTAQVVGIDEECNLTVRDDSGVERTLSSGEIRIRI